MNRVIIIIALITSSILHSQTYVQIDGGYTEMGIDKSLRGLSVAGSIEQTIFKRLSARAMFSTTSVTGDRFDMYDVSVFIKAFDGRVGLNIGGGVAAKVDRDQSGHSQTTSTLEVNLPIHLFNDNHAVIGYRNSLNNKANFGTIFIGLKLNFRLSRGGHRRFF